MPGRRTVLIDGCNCGLRFATSPPPKPGGAIVARLFDCGGLRDRGASDLVGPLAHWLASSAALGICVMDGKADLGRHAERAFAPADSLRIAFTPLALTADELMLQLLSTSGATRGEVDGADGAHALARLAGTAPGWVQLEVRAELRADAPADAPAARGAGARVSTEQAQWREDWSKPARCIYHLASGSAVCARLAAELERAADGSAHADPTLAVRVSRLRTSPVLCVTNDSRLRSACERAGALVVSPRVFFELIGVARGS